MAIAPSVVGVFVPLVGAAPGADEGAALALVVAVGVAAQWLARRLRIPAIIVLLAVGILAGPVLDLLRPDDLLGDLLFPAVSMAVAILLFEGGLSLTWRELGSARRPLVRLLTVGALVTFVAATLLAVGLTDLPAGAATLFGAIMVVTGPTVVISLVEEARLRPRLGRLLRWEGIFIDPVGAVLGVTVLELLLSQGDDPAASVVDLVLTTVLATGWGVSVGLAAGLGLTEVLRRHWVPDNQVNALCLAVVLLAWAGANQLFSESGLYAATLVGVVLANQRSVPIRAIHEYQVATAPLLLGSVFLLLAARVDPEDLRRVFLPGLAVTAGLVLVVRPLAVAASVRGTGLTRAERTYLALLAPRGIVAAAVSALFGLRLEQAGLAGGQRLAALTFEVVAGTVIVYGLAARPLAARLRVTRPEPKGVAIVGAAPWAVDLAQAISRADVPVLVITTDPDEAERARARDLLVYDERLGAEELIGALRGVGVRVAVTLSASEELTDAVLHRLVPELGRANVYKVARDQAERQAIAEEPAREGRELGGSLTQVEIARVVADGGRFAVLAADDPVFDGPAPVLSLLSVATDGTPHVLGPDHRPDRRHDRVVALLGGGAGTSDPSLSEGPVGGP